MAEAHGEGEKGEERRQNNVDGPEEMMERDSNGTCKKYVALSDRDIELSERGWQ